MEPLATPPEICNTEQEFQRKGIKPYGKSPPHTTLIGFCNRCQRIDMTASSTCLERLEQHSPRKDATGWVMDTLSNICRRMNTCWLCALLHFLVEQRFQERGMELESSFKVMMESTNCHFIKDEVVIVVVQTGKTSWVTLNDAFWPTRDNDSPPELSDNPNRERADPVIGPFHSNFGIKRSIEVRHLCDKLRTCGNHHRLHCHEISGRADTFPIFLIDTLRLCIVHSNTKSSYFTLSYVWGKTPNFLLTQSNVDALMQPGGLRQIWHKISRVIREAIQLVGEIDIYEERYLWVDSLCIFHDDREQKHKQIGQMDAIYGQAAMTIIALSGLNADSALLPSQERSDNTLEMLSEVEQQKRVRLIPDFTVPSRLVQQVGQPDYVYRSRGWTFQEEKLSRRILYCTNSGMLFRCRVLDGNVSWWDDSLDTREMPHEASAPSRKAEAISRWTSLVEAYSKRDFTYPSDALRAFAGISEALKRPVSGEEPLNILCGICLDLFPFSLLWSPLTYKEHQRRSSFPTWSWASSAGAIHFPYTGHRPDLRPTLFMAQLSGATTISPDTGEDTSLGTPPDDTNASFGSQRYHIRSHAILLLTSSTLRGQNTQIPSKTPTDVDMFYMLHIQVQLKVLKWSDRKFKVKRSRFGCESSLLQGRNIVGGVVISPQDLGTNKNKLTLIPLCKWDYTYFLIARCVGKDLYERLGIGYVFPKFAWPKIDVGSWTVYLI